jgi:hypothetical protein
MHGTITQIQKSRHVHLGGADDQTDSDAGNDWFVSAIRDLGINAAMLQILTGAEERTCYRYANGDRKPPAYFLLTLLQSEVGPQLLARLMDGCDAPWWAEHQRALKIGRAAIAADE